MSKDYHLYSADGLHRVTVGEKDGLFRFVAWTLVTEKEYDGITRSNWIPIRLSGVYGNVEDAERDARAEFTWLPPRNSS